MYCHSELLLLLRQAEGGRYSSDVLLTVVPRRLS